MSNEKFDITANPTPNPDAMKFTVHRQLVDGDPVSLFSAEDAEHSPMAEKIFALGGVRQIFAFQNFVTVTKEGDQPWQEFARAIGQTIREHIQGGAKDNFAPAEARAATNGDEKVALINQVLDEIRPMVAQDGGNIVFAGYQNGIVQLFMQGSCAGCPSSTLTLKAGIQRRLQEVLPEVQDVVAV
jgi:Fe-S cluster biogenesis protein NfuA